MISKTVAEIAALVKGTVEGNADEIITGASGIKEAQKGQITFLTRKKYESYLNETNASAVFVDHDMECTDIKKIFIRVSNPSSAFNTVVGLFISDLDKPFEIGISDKAFIGKNVNLGKNLTIQPFAVIDDNASIGDNTLIQAGTYIGREAKVGADCRIYPNVSILDRVSIGNRVIIHSGTVIGSDGFGFEPVPNGIPKKIFQVGRVVVEDDVEIGANVAIDRARSDKTWIRRGTKIDNLVHIAHNVEVGENCMLIGQSGLAGSCILGKGVIVAGQAGINGHIKLGDNVIATSKSGVTKDTDPGKMVSGFPACDHHKFKKVTVSLSHVPELIKKMTELEKKITELENKTSKAG